MLASLFLLCCLAFGQTKESESQKSVDVDYLQVAAGTSIFVYDGTEKPCDPTKVGHRPQPIGSAFLVGIANENAKGGAFSGWLFIVTAEHVVHNRTDVLLRMNRKSDGSKACFPLHLERSGASQNLFMPRDASTDLTIINVPTYPDVASVVLPYSWVLDKVGLKRYDLKVGTGVFTVGYLLGYPGESRNYPVTKFGRISVLTDEKWFLSERGFYEYAYIVELQNVPGLSGAPLYAYGQEMKMTPNLSFRVLPPLLVGIVKDVLLVQNQGTRSSYSQGLAAVEPGDKLKEMLKDIADTLRAKGEKPVLEFGEIQVPGAERSYFPAASSPH